MSPTTSRITKALVTAFAVAQRRGPGRRRCRICARRTPRRGREPADRQLHRGAERRFPLAGRGRRGHEPADGQLYAAPGQVSISARRTPSTPLATRRA